MMRSLLSIIPLFFITFFAHGHEVFCPFCQTMVAPLPNNTCPWCKNYLTTTPNTDCSRGACALDPVDNLAAGVAEKLLLTPPGSCTNTHLDFLLALQLSAQLNGEEDFIETTEEDNNTQPGVVLYDAKEDWDSPAPPSAFAGIQASLGQYLALFLLKTNQQTGQSNSNIQSIIQRYNNSNHTQDSLDSAILSLGYQWVPFNNAIFFEAVPDKLLEFLLSQLNTPSPDEILLVFFTEHSEIQFTYISLVFVDHNIFVTIANPNETAALQLAASPAALSTLLSAAFTLLNATQMYAYYFSQSGQ
ncbi:MAG: hypothetical protein ACR2PT_12215 [Endozoicomonas sp.]